MPDSRCLTAIAGVTPCDINATRGSATSPISGKPFGGNAACLDFASRSLVWIDDPGIGYYPVDPADAPYTDDYFAKYAGYAETALGRALNDARLDFVARHWQGELVDIGIGCGQFVQSRAMTKGFDVNPAGVRWLADRGLFCNPYAQLVDAISCWDSLEHIRNPAPLLEMVTEWVFVSIPIFTDLAHVLRSKHFRRDEHFLYYTERGFVAFMAAHGFECVASDDFETRLGREDIGSFAFRRA